MTSIFITSKTCNYSSVSCPAVSCRNLLLGRSWRMEYFPQNYCHFNSLTEWYANKPWIVLKTCLCWLKLKILHMLQSIYSNANSIVCSNNLYSKPFPHSKGVCQRCNLSPLLFNLFMDDLEGYLENHSLSSCQLNSYRLPLILFADDIVL